MTACHFTAQPRAELTHLGPVTVLHDGAQVRVLDGRTAVINGVKTRVFPGTGKEVPLELLGRLPSLVSDNIGLSDGPSRCTLTDLAGNWACCFTADLLKSPIWASLSAQDQNRIVQSLDIARFVQRAFATVPSRSQ
jgi:hypothetical protein